MRAPALHLLLSITLLQSQRALSAKESSLSAFHRVVRQQATRTIEAHGGPEDYNDDNILALHKKSLAHRIKQDIEAFPSSDEAASVASFHLTIAVVVWQWWFSNGYERYFTYGTMDISQPLPLGRVVEDATVVSGTRPVSSGHKVFLEPLPGLGSPSATGGSLFLTAKMQSGVWMSCMVFYFPPNRRQPSKKRQRVQKFENAVVECSLSLPGLFQNTQSLERSGDGNCFQARTIDLDELASCVQQAAMQGSNSRWKGVAAVAAYSGPKNLHEDYGVDAPEGFLMLHHECFDVPNDSGVAFNRLYVFFFTMMSPARV